MISLEQKPEYLDFYNQVLGVKRIPDPNHIVWITKLDEAGNILAVVAFRNFTQHTCEMSIATNKKSNWASREFIAVCYRYAFNQMKLSRVNAVINEKNERALRMNRKLGCTEEAKLKNFFGENDGILMRMLPSECKWIQETSHV